MSKHLVKDNLKSFLWFVLCYVVFFLLKMPLPDVFITCWVGLILVFHLIHFKFLLLYVNCQASQYTIKPCLPKHKQCIFHIVLKDQRRKCSWSFPVLSSENQITSNYSDLKVFSLIIISWIFSFVSKFCLDLIHSFPSIKYFC